MAKTIAELTDFLTARPACNTRVGGDRCEIPPKWQMTVSCERCGQGGGPACDVHREELGEAPRHKRCKGGRIYILDVKPLATPQNAQEGTA